MNNIPADTIFMLQRHDLINKGKLHRIEVPTKNNILT